MLPARTTREEELLPTNRRLGLYSRKLEVQKEGLPPYPTDREVVPLLI